MKKLNVQTLLLVGVAVAFAVAVYYGIRSRKLGQTASEDDSLGLGLNLSIPT